MSADGKTGKTGKTCLDLKLFHVVFVFFSIKAAPHFGALGFKFGAHNSTSSTSPRQLTLLFNQRRDAWRPACCLLKTSMIFAAVAQFVSIGSTLHVLYPRETKVLGC